jgi:muconolactone delta-isomerase
MLFYVQMRWKIDPPLTLDQFWDLERQEIDVALQTIKEGKVRGLYKVAAQPRVIGIIEADSIDDLDRTAMGRLPLRNLLEFEVVWALRDYESFAVDVREGYGRLPAAKLSDPSPGQ